MGAQGAADLYRAFLLDTAARLARVPADRRELWVPDPPAARELTASLPDFRLRRQRGGDLGERLRHAFRTAFDEGAGRVVVVGSDHPTLPPDHLERAFDALRTSDVVLGPTPDGGYYAVGLRSGARPAAGEIFGDVPWSTPEVLERTEANARGLGLAVSRLPPWYDVDEPEELERLGRDVEEGSATARALARLGRERR